MILYESNALLRTVLVSGSFVFDRTIINYAFVIRTLKVRSMGEIYILEIRYRGFS